MRNATDKLDRLIAEAFNDPFGDETPPPWEQTTSRVARAHRRGGSWTIRLGVVGVAALAIALPLLLLPAKRADLLETAAAAVPSNGPVLHLVYRTPPARIPFLDVATGKTRTKLLPTTDEIWYDPGRGLFKEIRHYPGYAIGTETLWKSKQRAFSSLYGPLRVSGDTPGLAEAIQIPPEATLLSQYKQALTKRDARLIGTGTVAGHKVQFIYVYHCTLRPFPGHPGSSLGCANTIDETVALDKQTHLPVAIYRGRTTSGTPRLIRTVEFVRRARAPLTKPARTPYPPTLIPGPANCPCATIGIRSSHAIPPITAVDWLGRRPYGFRDTLAGRPLSVARADLLNPPGSSPRHGLELIYGPSCNGKPKYGAGYLLIRQATTPELAYQTLASLIPPGGSTSVPLLQGMTQFAQCGAPKIGFYASQDRPEPTWTAAFRAHGLYVSVTAKSKKLTTSAVRQLLEHR